MRFGNVGVGFRVRSLRSGVGGKSFKGLNKDLDGGAILSRLFKGPEGF